MVLVAQQDANAMQGGMVNSVMCESALGLPAQSMAQGLGTF
jgi:hypothetical protein